MSDFVFFELEPATRLELKLPSHPIPVRRDYQQHVFLAGGEVDFAAMLEELNVFLNENPELDDDYNSLIAILTAINGMDAASRGFHERALYFYERGLDAEPASVSLRSHYALSLKCLGRDVEARREIEALIAQTPKDTILPVLWMILSRLYAHDGEYEKAYWLLKDVSTLIPDEAGFWDALAEMEEKAGLRVASVAASAQAVTAAPVAMKWHYAVADQVCSPVSEDELRAMLASGQLPSKTLVWNALLPNWIDASAAGLVAPPVLPNAALVHPDCPRCHQAHEPGMRFCIGCGLPLV